MRTVLRTISAGRQRVRIDGSWQCPPSHADDACSRRMRLRASSGAAALPLPQPAAAAKSDAAAAGPAGSAARLPPRPRSPTTRRSVTRTSPSRTRRARRPRPTITAGFLNYYCFKCHNTTDWAGGVAFDTHDAGRHPGRRRDLGEGGAQAARPAHAAAGQAAAANGRASQTFVALDGRHARQGRRRRIRSPGRVALHRLNRNEYANAVRDLLACEVDVDALLPQDDVERRLRQRRQRAAGVAVVPRPVPRGRAHRRACRRSATRGARPIGTHVLPPRLAARSTSTSTACRSARAAACVVEHIFPADGEYELNIGDMARRALGLRHGVREHARRAARRQGVLSRRRSAAKRT